MSKTWAVTSPPREGEPVGTIGRGHYSCCNTVSLWIYPLLYPWHGVTADMYNRCQWKKESVVQFVQKRMGVVLRCTALRLVSLFQTLGFSLIFQAVYMVRIKQPNVTIHTSIGGQDSSVGRASDSWSKGCEFEFRQERWENFLLRSELTVLTVIQCPFHPRVTAVARKIPRSFCQKCRWQVRPKPLTQRSRRGLTMPLSWHSVRTYQETSSSGNTQSQSSQLTEPLWSDPGLQMELVCASYSPLKGQKKKIKK